MKEKLSFLNLYHNFFSGFHFLFIYVLILTQSPSKHRFLNEIADKIPTEISKLSTGFQQRTASLSLPTTFLSNLTYHILTESMRYTERQVDDGFTELHKNISIVIEKKQELKVVVDNILRHRIISNQVSELRENVTLLDIEVEDVCRLSDESIGESKVNKRLQNLVAQLNQKICRLLQQTRELTNELVVSELLYAKGTVNKNMEAIMESLRDPLIYKIGVYGMAGSGKTTTLTSIASYVSTTNDFDKVIWVFLGKNCDLDRVKMDIAHQLEQNENQSMEIRPSSWISARLKAYKFLIIFDDIWAPISLDEVGIPKHRKYCKIVLATCCLDICHAMKTDKNIKLNLLSKDDAWELFLSKADDEIFNLEVTPLVEKIVDECDGLPLAIIEIGNFMNHPVDISMLKQVLEFLRGLRPQVIECLKFVFDSLSRSYMHLKIDGAWVCFDSLAIFPKDYKIEGHELVKYWIAGGFIEARSFDTGYRILRELMDACLIEECSNLETGQIKIHSLTRCLATQLLQRGNGGEVLIEAGLGLSDSPDINKWKRARKMSLEKNRIEVLPNQPDCPKLFALILRENPLSQNIFSSFFSQMPILRFLDLSRTGISELPSSLFELLNLEALYLQECTCLEKISSLANLKKLRELYLSHTSIRELPQGMEELIRLRSLDISFTHQLENRTIPRLPVLEELYIEGSRFLCVDAPIVANTIMEIRCLKGLLKLGLSFVRLDDYQCALMSMEWRMLKRFNIIISHTIDLFNIDWDKNRQNCVYICNQKVCDHSSTLLLPPSTQELKVSLCDIPRLTEILCLRNMQSLRKCHIERCSLMSGDCLILGDEMEEHTLTKLENLSLENVRALTVVWTGAVRHPCFTNLRVLEVQWCGGLKTLFSTDLLNCLKNIKVIKIRECKVLEEIVQGASEEGNEDYISTPTTSTTINLPCLHTLILQGLPELHTISEIIWVCVLLLRVEVVRCPKLKKIPFSVESVPRLKTIRGEKDWWGSIGKG